MFLLLMTLLQRNPVRPDPSGGLKRQFGISCSAVDEEENTSSASSVRIVYSFIAFILLLLQ